MSDLIRRSDAIAICKRFASAKYRVPYLEQAFDAIPAVEPKRGEWICHKGKWIDFDYYPTKYECSQCHHYVDVGSDKNYCPNCGADMRGENNGTDKEMR